MNVLPVNAVLIRDRDNLWTLGAKNKCIRRHNDWRIIIRQYEFNLPVHSGVKFASLVGHLNFYLHGARLWVDCARRACDLAVEFLTGIFLENNFRCESFVNRRRILLRREHVNAKHIALHHAEKRRAGISGPGCYKRPDIDISSRDLSSKRREDLLEPLDLFELL